MRSKVLMLLGLALALSLPTYTQTKVGTAADEAAILKNRDAQNAAYNKHDGKAYAALMTIDADRVDAAGTLTGRAQIEKYYQGCSPLI
jgi:ketosteroid isomerase-like protein